MRIFGFHAVLARLKRSPESISELYVDASRSDPRMRELIKLSRDAGLKLHEVDGARIERLCAGKRHQGVAALVEAEAPSLTLDELLANLDSAPDAAVTLLLLDGVTDPRNLGACLRVADGAGVTAVIAPKDHACGLTEVAMQTASGAAESIPYLMVTNLARTLDELKERSIWIVGADERGECDLYQADLPGSICWVLGAEGEGMRRLTRERCDELVKIPMSGSVASLNVSVAAGVCLFESRRRLMAGKR